MVGKGRTGEERSDARAQGDGTKHDEMTFSDRKQAVGARGGAAGNDWSTSFQAGSGGARLRMPPRLR